MGACLTGYASITKKRAEFLLINTLNRRSRLGAKRAIPGSLYDPAAPIDSSHSRAFHRISIHFALVAFLLLETQLLDVASVHKCETNLHKCEAIEIPRLS